MNKMDFKKFEAVGYKKFAQARNIIFLPLAKALNFLKVTPNMVSYFGVMVMIGFLFTIVRSQGWAVVLLAFSLFLDNLDGVLARYQKIDSDKGKFIDMVCDNVNFTLFIAGLIYGGLLSGVIGLIYAYTMVLSKLFRTIQHAFSLESDWYFKSVAGFLPNCFVGLSYLIFLWNVVSKQNYCTESSLLFGSILLLDAMVYYKKIISRTHKK